MKNCWFCFSFFLITCWSFVFSNENLLTHKITYNLSNEQIDVVIPCADTDLQALELCIKGVKENIDVRRIIIVSPRPLTDNAEWFDEKKYPFSKFDIALQMLGDETAAKQFLHAPYSRIGWIYQQFLKLYAQKVIPNISANVLIIDADTIFLNPVTFVGHQGEGLYNVGDYGAHPPYFVHMQKLIPGLSKVFSAYSGICHHMLFQKPGLDDLFDMIENYHHMDAWKAMARFINPYEGSGISEYEMYFNFIFTRTDQMKIRPLKWEDTGDIKKLPQYKELGYHYVSWHHYLRKNI